jgi:biopolymer transport protein ExbB
MNETMNAAAAGNLAGSHPYGLAAALGQADAVGLFVFLLLAAMSIASWYYIAAKSIEQLALRRAARQTPDAFWSAPDLAVAERDARDRAGDPFAALALAGVEASRAHAASTRTLGAACDLSDFVTRALRQSIVATTARLEAGQTLLASVGSTAPFIGLFGTVWGIYHALVAISQSGQGTLDKVAGPVGEALIMTGAGLAVAIPAVLGYNMFVRANRLLLAQLDGFAHDLHAALAVGPGAPSGSSVAPRAASPARPSSQAA